MNVVRKGFLGLESLNRDDHIRLGLFGALLLALECVLAGLVTDAAVRGYIIHALTAGLAVWALQDPTDVSIRATGSAGVAAVVNEALMLADAQASLRYLLPGLLLLGVSIWILERSIGKSSMPSRDSQVSTLVSPPLRAVSRSDRSLAIGISLVGGALSLYGLLAADWVLVRAVFGLIRETYTFQELRLAWQDFGTPDAISQGFLGAGQVLTYLVVLEVGFAVFFALTEQFAPGRTMRAAMLVLAACASVVNFLIVAALLAASSNVVVLGGAWLLPVGLVFSAYGVWKLTAQ